MNNELTRKVLLGVSTVIGLVIAGGIYRTALRATDERELIGDGEIISEEVIEES